MGRKKSYVKSRLPSFLPFIHSFIYQGYLLRIFASTGARMIIMSHSFFIDIYTFLSIQGCVFVWCVLGGGEFAAKSGGGCTRTNPRQLFLVGDLRRVLEAPAPSLSPAEMPSPRVRFSKFLITIRENSSQACRLISRIASNLHEPFPL